MEECRPRRAVLPWGYRPKAKAAPAETEAGDPQARLLEVAISHFGRAGFKGASTRAIATDAGTMMSSITYHFGGKEGLYLAAARQIARLMRGWMAPAIERANAITGGSSEPTAALAALHFLCDGMLDALTAHETEGVARFIFNEQAEPGEAFSLIYDGAMGALIDTLVRLLQAAVGHRVSECEARVRAVAIFGQILVFRVSRATVLRANGWVELGPDQLLMIKRIIACHVDAIVAQIIGQERPARS